VAPGPVLRTPTSSGRAMAAVGGGGAADGEGDVEVGAVGFLLGSPVFLPCSSVGAVWRVTWWPAPWGLVGARGSAMVVGRGWSWRCSVAPWGCCRVRRATSLVLLAICVARRHAVTTHHSAPRGFCRGNPSHLGTMSVAPPASCPS
jgi:hypothetical protein